MIDKKYTVSWRPLGSLPPYNKLRKKWQEEAWREAMRMTGRPDSPERVFVNGVSHAVPEDLVDRDGTMQVTSSGHLVSGSMLYEDTQLGTYSPANLIWFAAGPVLALPFSMMDKLVTDGGWIGSLATTSMFVLASGYLYSTYKILGPFWGTIAIATGGLSALSAIAGSMGVELPGLLSAGPMAFAACAVPLLYTWAKRRERTYALLNNYVKYMFGLTGKFTRSHLPARVEQAIGAVKDTSPQIVIGYALGVLSKKWFGFAPDAGKEMILTCLALTKHFMTFGKSGSGKTSRFLRVILDEWINTGWGGGLIMDGKGQLGLEYYERMRDKVDLIEPGMVDVSLTEGLTAEQFTNTIYDLQASAKGDNKIWDEQGFKWLYSATTILEAAKDIERSENELLAAAINERNKEREASGEPLEDATPPSAQFPWSYASVYWFTANLNNADGINDILQWVKSSDQYRSSKILQDSIAFATVQLPQMDEKIAGSVLFTALSWLAPVMTSELARAWSDLEHGYDITNALRGRMVAFNMPASKYGKSGRIVAALIKKRFMKGIELRPFDWETNGSGHKPAILMMDECQVLMTPNGDESRLMPMARSLGLSVVTGTQSVDSMRAALGRDEAAPVMDVYSNWAILKASNATYEWASQDLGPTESVQFQRSTGVMDVLGYGRALLAGPAYDKHNPMRKTIRSVLFHSSGKFGTIGRFFEGVFSTKNTYKNRIQSALESSAVWVKEPVATMAEISTYLSRPGIALIKVERGGGMRVDFCKTVEPIFAPNNSKAQKSLTNEEQDKQEWEKLFGAEIDEDAIEIIDSTEVPVLPDWISNNPDLEEIFTKGPLKEDPSKKKQEELAEV
jgi:hypothetical protein